MNKAVILKIAGLITVPLLVMIVAMYFLYPYINKEEYNELVQAQEEKLDAEFEALGLPAQEDSVVAVLSDTTMVMDSVAVDTLVTDELQLALEENTLLHKRVDSLIAEIEVLKANQPEETDAEDIQELSKEEFAQRIKSLLNLEEDDLAPILEKMTNEQLVRLYNGGGTIQREKILRSLNSDKAAKLMTEIML
ncbi:hypothetical protein [Gracilimonas sediminicola]|uniref:Magnesium transporter MgtE intracellular domain-containing protein n=1 Tax=Gracilimonas sediminicola TaxID=2952158 RepID=A0A9X2L432_9BACT|nr:hypothetical protein [Gracilimonas sediminicola]MCP9291892.1 hypothetical protein [Gracilimonas sediminicola]